MVHKIKNTLVIFLFVSFAFPASASATSYFVDNDCSNNGNGESQTCASSQGQSGPFNSLSNAQSIITDNQSDNQLLFKKNQTFSGQFTVSAYGTEGHPFNISSYGTGNKPIIIGGRDNVMISCASCHYIVIDGLELSHPDRYGIIVVHPAGNITIHNSSIHHASGGVVLWGSSNNTIENNDVSWNSNDGITISVGVENDPHPATDNTINNNKVHHNLRYGIIPKSHRDYHLNNVKIYGNEAYNNSAGIYLVYTDNSEIYQNDIHDNGIDCQATGDCIGEEYGFAIQSGSYNSFYENTITKTHNVGIGIYGSQESAGANADGNKLYRNTVSETYSGWKRDINWQCWPGNSVGNNNEIYNNIFHGDGVNFVIGDSNPDITGNIAYNNIFYGGSSGVYFESTSTHAGWTFKNNIFANNSSYSIYASRRSGGLVIQNNIYYKPAGGTLVNYNSNSYTNSNINTLDASAITSDPQFVGTLNWYDFRLQEGSPAIDKGLNLDNTFSNGFDPNNSNFPSSIANQNDFGTNWEIGPFAYTSDSSPPALIPGDANEDGNVDGIDYVIWLNNYQQEVIDGHLSGDFDGSGVVDGIDYVIWLNSYIKFI